MMAVDPNEHDDMHSLFTSSELLAFDGFLHEQLGFPSAAQHAGGPSSAAEPTSTKARTYPSSSAARLASPALDVAGPATLCPSETTHAPATAGVNLYMSETPAEREERLKKQAEELAAWFSRAQAAFSIPAASPEASTSYGPPHASRPSGEPERGSQDLPSADHQDLDVHDGNAKKKNGKSSDHSGLRPKATSSASSTSNSDSLRTPHGSYSKPFLTPPPPPYLSSSAPSTYPHLQRASPGEYPSSMSHGIKQELPDREHRAETDGSAGHSLYAPPQAKRQRMSFSHPAEHEPQPESSTALPSLPGAAATTSQPRVRGKARTGSASNGASTSVATKKKSHSISAGSTAAARRASTSSNANASSSTTPQPKPSEGILSSSAPLSSSMPAHGPSQSPGSSSQLISNSGTNGSASASGLGQAAKLVLTDEQKRANHILSEQKRRTAIRGAYDELCTIVPALKAAINEYNERLSKIHGGAGPPASNGNGTADAGAGGVAMLASLSGAGGGNANAEQAYTVAGVLTGGIEVGGEKIDGRAGPKSEAVVLGKTVDYLSSLLDQRQDLLSRLDDARALARRRGANLGLPPEASSSSSVMPWNVKWKGVDWSSSNSS